MKKVGNNFCMSSDLLDLSKSDIFSIVENNNILLKEYEKGSLDTSITISDDLQTSVLLGKSFPLSMKVKFFVSDILSFVGSIIVNDIPEKYLSDLINITDSNDKIEITVNDFVSFEYIKDTGILYVKGNNEIEECPSSLLNNFVNLINYLNDFKIPVKSLAIMPIENNLSPDLVKGESTCYIGWCICDKSSPLYEWTGEYNENEYFMAILI